LKNIDKRKEEKRRAEQEGNPPESINGKLWIRFLNKWDTWEGGRAATYLIHWIVFCLGY
jgi:uncharacterized membrane protein